MIQPARWGNLCSLQEALWSYPHDRTCISQSKDMDTDNTQAACCLALRLYVVHVVLSFSSASYSSSCRSHVICFFLPFPLRLPSADYLSQALGSKLIRHSGTKQERTGSSLLDPTRSGFLFRTEKAPVLKKRDEDLCLLPKKTDEQGNVQGTLLRKRGLPLPMIKATIHPSIPKTVQVPSYCLRIILHRAAFTF